MNVPILSHDFVSIAFVESSELNLDWMIGVGVARFRSINWAWFRYLVIDTVIDKYKHINQLQIEMSAKEQYVEDLKLRVDEMEKNEIKMKLDLDKMKVENEKLSKQNNESLNFKTINLLLVEKEKLKSLLAAKEKELKQFTAPNKELENKDLEIKILSEKVFTLQFQWRKAQKVKQEMEALLATASTEMSDLSHELTTMKSSRTHGEYFDSLECDTLRASKDQMQREYEQLIAELCQQQGIYASEIEKMYNTLKNMNPIDPIKDLQNIKSNIDKMRIAFAQRIKN